MKTNLLFAIFLVMANSLYSQTTNHIQPFPNIDYLEKSRDQRVIGNTLLGLGSAAIIIPSFIFLSNSPPNGDYTMAFASMGLGMVMIIGSTVPFDASGRNRIKGRPNNLYLQKSRDQRLTGYLVLGLGTAVFIIPPANLVNVDDPAEEDYAIALFPPLMGAAMILASVPILIQAGVNKRKGMSISFKMKQYPLFKTATYYPKVSLPFL
jgi:hypothetical protein